MSTLQSLALGARKVPGNERAFYDQAAVGLRIGLGILFVIGGTAKLSKALDPAHADALVALYISDKGYINAFFQAYLFEGPIGSLLDPWIFLTALSTIELVSGVALIAGFLVRPICLIFAFMLWSFVFALPVTTSPTAAIGEPTYLAPAMFVQIRDIGLSGLFFVLYNLGSGAFSVDRWLSWLQPMKTAAWDSLGLLLRLSLGTIFLVGGFFAGMPNITSFDIPGPILAVIGVIIVSGVGVRIGAAAFLAVMLWYIAGKISVDVGLLANLNAIKREIAFVAASGVLTVFGGGRLFTLANLVLRPRRSTAPAEPQTHDAGPLATNR